MNKLIYILTFNSFVFLCSQIQGQDNIIDIIDAFEGIKGNRYIGHCSLNRTIQKIEKEYEVSNDQWTISLLHRFRFGESSTDHLILFLMGKLEGQYRVWAADFMDHKSAYEFESAVLRGVSRSLGPKLAIMPGCIRTTSKLKKDENGNYVVKYKNFLEEVKNESHNWSRKTWQITFDSANKIIEEVEAEENDPPYYNYFNHNPWAIFYRKPTFNCAGYTQKKVAKATNEKVGTQLARYTGVRIPVIESHWNHQ